MIGFAAFSPSGGADSASVEDEAAPVDASPQLSARVASAILALRVTDTSPNTVPLGQSAADVSETTTTVEPSTTTSEIPTDTSVTSSSTEATTTTTTKPRDTTPPALTITSPADGSTVSDRIVKFSGTAEAGAKVYSGPFDAKVADNGDWSIKLVVATTGETKARITAEDAAGNTTVKSVTVKYSAPAPPPPPSPTTTQGSTPTTTAAGNTWSPLWPADSGGSRPIESWRPLVEKYWPADRVNCALNIIYRESRGNPRAYNSYASAEGLFQHLAKYWKARAAAAGFRDSNGLYASPYSGEANIAVSAHLANNSNPWYSHWTVAPADGPLECTP